MIWEQIKALREGNHLTKKGEQFSVLSITMSHLYTIEHKMNCFIYLFI